MIYDLRLKPYFECQGVTLYHGDCLEIMRTLPPHSIDLVATDLPYGATSCDWDAKINLPELWALYRHCVQMQGALCFTASQPFTSELLMSNAGWFRYEWIWKKNRCSNFLNARKQPLKAHESVLVFGRKNPRYFAQKTNGHKPINRAYRRANSSPVYRTHLESINNGGDTTRWPTSVVDIKCLANDSKERLHPTQKPVELYEYFINTYTRPGEVVLDNCAGSGSAALACMKTNRRVILIERLEKYCEQAAKRISRYGRV